MPIIQGSTNVNISGNPTFNEIHGDATIIRFGNGEFKDIQCDMIKDYMASSITLPDVSSMLKNHSLSQSIVNLPRSHASYSDYKIKKRIGLCFQGTREALLREMAEWAISADERRIYVLSGLAGIGKSTVAYTVAAKADNLGLLGASFFFSRDDADRTNAEKFFTAIAFQLCAFDEKFAQAIGSTLLTERGSAATTKDPQEQLQALIIEPLRSIVASRVRPIVVVVDALDECSDDDGPSVLWGLSQLVRDLPSFKVVLTTRPQPTFDYLFGSLDGHQMFRLQDIEASIVDGDIRRYLVHSLSREQVRQRLRNPKENWQASEAEIESLVQASGRLFIVASTAVLVILDKIASDPAAQMAKLLRGFTQHYTPLKDINQFYTVILRYAIPADCDDIDIVERYQTVVGVIILIQKPLPVTTLARLVDRKEKDVYAVLRHLQSVILLGDDDTPQIYHKSFPDFITDLTRCKDIDLRIDPGVHHTQIGICCFRIMNGNLKRNILDLDVPARFMMNKQGIAKQRISDDEFREKIPPELQYACVYWANHVEDANIEDTDLIEELEVFVNRHLLYWFEALSWLGELKSAHPSLRLALNILKSIPSDSHRLLSDGLRFISKFYEIVEQSALHTYYSALPFTPTESLLYQRYSKEMMENLCRVEGRPEKWDALIANPTHGPWVKKVVFSPDNSTFVSWSKRDKLGAGILKSWDAASGTPISMITGDRFTVSADFSTVASSKGNVVTVHSMKGAVPIASFVASRRILKLALSSAGSLVATGSSDGTVRLWDCRKGELIANFGGFGCPREEGGEADEIDENLCDEENDNEDRSDDEGEYGNDDDNGNRDEDDDGDDNDDDYDDYDDDDLLELLAFSPVGSRLAYGSLDGGIKLQDAVKGRFTADLHYQSKIHNKFAFLRNGSWIAALSSDGTLMLWTSKSGELVRVVEDAGNMLAICINGSLLATAFSAIRNSLTVKVWEIDEIASGNPGTHMIHLDMESQLDSMAVSQNHIAIAPGCDAVTLYNITSCTTTTLPCVAPVTAIFSLDGTRLVVGTMFGSIYLWDIPTVTMDGAQPGKQTTGVSALAFSPVCSILACGFDDGAIELWETGIKKQLTATYQCHTKRIAGLAFSPDGDYLLSGSSDGTVILREGQNGTPIRTIKHPSSSGPLRAVGLSCSIFAAATEDDIALWDLRTLSLIDNLNAAPCPQDLSFSKHGLHLAYSNQLSVTSISVTILDVVNRLVLATFKVDHLIRSMTFSPDDSQLTVQLNTGDFQLFSIASKQVIEGQKLGQVARLCCIPLWHGVPIWLSVRAQNALVGLFSQHEDPVPVLWVPDDLEPLGVRTQGSSMFALSDDGHVILVRSSIGVVG